MDFPYDLNTPTPTELSVLNTSNLGLSNFAFNPIDGFVYGITNNGLITKVNLANGNAITVRAIGNSIPSQTYGAVYFDAKGTLYLSGNSTRKVCCFDKPRFNETCRFLF
ncbi:MAG: hypothetical protein ACI8WW_000007 [Oceanospirillaceae bacterium]